jgi:hypothetical protein
MINPIRTMNSMMNAFEVELVILKEKGIPIVLFQTQTPSLNPSTEPE